MSNTIVEANKILLRRKNKLIVGNVGYVMSDDTQRYLVTMTKNIETLGYTFSNQLFNKLKTLTKEELFEFYKELVSELKKNIGADVQYNPMYPNFPESVMEENEMQLYMNAIIHYWSYGTILPCEEKNERLPLFDETKVKVIDSGEWEDLYEIFDNLCRSKTSISQTDKEDLEWIMKNSNVKFPDEIPLKENVALIGKIYVESNPLATADKLQKLFKTATDVLRLITAMSDGDISLATNTKYRSFKRKERRLLLELLDNCGNIQEDMLRYKNRWIRVGERLHPGEYKTGRYDNARLAFDKLRNNEKIQTFNSKVDHNMKDKNFEKAILLLQKRPGELARRLDYLLRTVDKKNNVINTFKDVANKVSTPVLLQIKEHFKSRQEELNTRVFFPKGCLARSYAIENKLPDIDKKYCDAIVKICENALIETYKSKDFMGNVYLSEEYKNYIVPFSQRSASKSLKTIVRGSRIKLKESAKAMRAFIWWTNTDDERVDIDLSATVFDENWNYINHVSYTRLRDDEMYIYHSGDIINGGDVNGVGVSEFLDVDIESVVDAGGRYVVYQVYNYSEQTFGNLPHAMFGWMEREDVNSGEIYEPRTVAQKMDLTSQSKVCIPVIFDCVERKFIWCDMNVSLDGCHHHRGGNNVESNLMGVAATCYSIVNMKKPNLYDLIDLHIRARGLRVENKEEADIVFDIDDGITPFDTEVFMGEYI
jgi:hypothetical protein